MRSAYFLSPAFRALFLVGSLFLGSYTSIFITYSLLTTNYKLSHLNEINIIIISLLMSPLLGHRPSL
jgi:hypothetical protein